MIQTDFGRYQTPSFCLAAAHNARALLRRSIVAQQMVDSLRQTDPTHDTLPAGVVAVARACSRRFAASTTAAAELPDLFELALLAHDDALAQTVLARRLTLAPDDSVRVDLQQHTVAMYLQAEPAQVTAAEQLTAQLDAQGAKARLGRVQAHAWLILFGLQTFDHARMRREAEQVIALTRSVPATALEAYWGPLSTAYHALLTIAFFTAPDSLPALARQAQQDLSRVPTYGAALARATLPQVLGQLCPAALWQQLGRPTPPLTADAWIPAAAKDSVVPVRGRVSLFVYVTDNCDGGYTQGAQVLDPIQSGCDALYTRLRRWHQEYGKAGLDITLVTAMAPGLSGTVLSGPQSLAQAVENLKWYFLDYLKLPVQRLAVQTVPIGERLPAPDGRISAGGGAPYYQTYLGAKGGLGGGQAGNILLVDRAGAEVYRIDVSSMLEPTSIFEPLLRRVMASSAQAARPANPARPVAPTSPPSASLPPASRSMASRMSVSTLRSTGAR